MKCPQCNSENVINSRRRGVERLFKSFVPLGPYRCRECWNRFWAFRNPLKSAASKVIAGIILVILMTPPAYNQFKKWDMGNDKKTIRKSVEPTSPAMTGGIGNPPDITKFFPDEKPKVTDNSSAEPQIASENTEGQDASRKTNPDTPSSDIAAEPSAPSTEPNPADLALKPSETATQQAVPDIRTADQEEAKSSDKPLTTLTVGAVIPEDTSVREQPSQKILKSIVSIDKGNEIEVSILTNQSNISHSHFFFTENGILKCVIDLKGKWKKQVKDSILTDNEMIREIRTGMHSDKVRVVLDLKGNKKPSSEIISSSEGLIVKLKKAN